MVGKNYLVKDYMELLARDNGTKVRVARYHNVFGPEGTWQGGKEKAPAAMCRKVAMSKGEVEIWGDGEQTEVFFI